MNEREWAKRFSRDVDSGLDESGLTDSEPMPTEYRQALNLARTLTALDLTYESQVRATLRRELLNRIDAREGRRDTAMKTYSPYRLRRRLLVAIGSALALLLVMIFLYPGGPTVFAQGVGNGAKLMVLGAYSTAQQIEAQVAGKPVPDDSWKIRVFPGYNEGGNGLPGTNPIVQSVASLEEAQKLVSFRIKTPGYLPEGYNLREIKLAPIWTGLGARLVPSNPGAFLLYGLPGADIAIVQKPLGPQPSSDPNVAVGMFSGFMTNGTLEEVKVRGRTGAWADGQLLMWEEDDISFIVGGPKLSLDEATRIAESLK